MSSSLASPSPLGDRLSQIGAKARPETWIMAGIALILALQFGEIFRRGINWDEFNHYHHIWEHKRGDLTNILNTMHSRVFSWVPALPGNAVDHIIVIRLFMYIFELAIIVGIVGIAQRFTSRSIGLLCALAYITFPFVFGHGYSFRFDPPSTALMIMAMWAIIARPMDAKTIALAGTLIGVAMMVTIKIVLLLPAFAGVLWLRWNEERLVPSFAVKTALTGIVALAVAGLIYFLLSLGVEQQVVSASQKRASGVGSIMFALEPKPYWITAGVAAIKAPLVTALIALFGYCLYVSERSKPEKIALFALFFTLTTLIYYHNTAPYFYVFLMPWVLIACSIPMQWVATRFSPVLLAFVFTISGVMTWSMEGDSPINKQRALIDTAYETFPEDTVYFDFMGMLARYRQANDFMTPLKVKRMHAEGRSVYTEAMAEAPIPLVVRNDWQWEALFRDPANVPTLLNGLPVYTEKDAAALVDTYIPFWGPFMLAGEVIPAGEQAHSFTVRVPGPYTTIGGPVSLNGRTLADDDVIELERGEYEVSAPRQAEVTLRWGDGIEVPTAAPPEAPLNPNW